MILGILWDNKKLLRTWLHKIRKAMVRSDRAKLSGTVEVDEKYIGGEEHSGSKGRGTGNKVIVAIAVELQEFGNEKKQGLRKIGGVRLAVIKDASGKSLQSFMIENVEKGREIITDGWAGYSFVKISGWNHTIFVQSKKKDGEII